MLNAKKVNEGTNIEKKPGAQSLQTKKPQDAKTGVTEFGKKRHWGVGNPSQKTGPLA